MKPGRNDPCSCGSGKKYKNCCLGKTEIRPPEPSSVECNQLIALSNAGRHAELESRTRLLVGQYPNFGFAWKLLGESLYMQGKDALPALQKATRLLPDDADAFSNLGVVLTDLERLDEAVTSCHRALEIKPDDARAHNNLGNALKKLGQLNDAITCYRSALKIKPDYAKAHNNLGAALQELGHSDDAAANYLHALKLKPDYIEAQNNLLFTLNYTASHTPAYYLEQARQYGRLVAGKVGTRFTAWQCAVQPERLRVGLVSGDLFNHSVGHFLEGLITRIDPARIELIAYPTYHKEDSLTARIRPYFSAWKPLYGLGDEAAARLIHADRVHVLIDLAGHTEHNRLPVFAWKPAPVQVTWLGLPATTGVAEIDYVLGDPHAIPAGFENHFSETVWRMPESCLCLTVPVSPLQVAPLPALAAGYVTFGSFNNLTKMTDAVVAVWARILKSVPNSRLLLKTKQLGDPVVCTKTLQRFAAHSIASDRLLLAGRIVSDGDHLAAYNKIDIALDTFPYPGVTTSVEALWMGVPVLNLRGDRFMSCTAGSIAHNAGLPDWIAADEDDYVAKAMAFASDLEHLAALRASLRQHLPASPLFDAPRFARNFEDAMWGMWRASDQGNSPAHSELLISSRN
jgi:protein O-GlcNAc transferase